jgi:hypothetical protein
MMHKQVWNIAAVYEAVAICMIESCHSAYELAHLVRNRRSAENQMQNVLQAPPRRGTYSRGDRVWREEKTDFGSITMLMAGASKSALLTCEKIPVENRTTQPTDQSSDFLTARTGSAFERKCSTRQPGELFSLWNQNA